MPMTSENIETKSYKGMTNKNFAFKKLLTQLTLSLKNNSIFHCSDVIVSFPVAMYCFLAFESNLAIAM